MSRKGDCYDNAAMESWNHSYKVEAIHGERFPTRAEARQQTFEYIEVYYNRKRLHSKLGGFKLQVQHGLLTSLRWHLSQLQHLVIDLKRGSEPMNLPGPGVQLPGNGVEFILCVA